jgi:hypothetical protein
MRSAALIALILMVATPATAAPICFTRAGDPVHCGMTDAMPIGWKQPPQDAARRELSQPHPSDRAVFETMAVLVLLFALIALLPEFDGARDKDWEPEKRDRD